MVACWLKGEAIFVDANGICKLNGFQICDKRSVTLLFKPGGQVAQAGGHI